MYLACKGLVFFLIKKTNSSNGAKGMEENLTRKKTLRENKQRLHFMNSQGNVELDHNGIPLHTQQICETTEN